MSIIPEPHRIVSFFLPRVCLLEARPCTGGNINQTWILRYRDNHGGTGVHQAVLQRINPAVFPEPATVMDNFRILSRHLAQTDPVTKNRPLYPRPCCNPDGEDCYLDEVGGLWRLMDYIGPSRTCNGLHPGQAAAVGATLAHFHLQLKTLAPETIRDPLPGFHDTPAYLARFDAVCADYTPRTEAAAYCLEQIQALRPLATLLHENSRHHGRQLVHADPKCANFLFAHDSDTVLGLIDLDTVRPGFLLHDLGDCLRSCCNRGSEEDSSDPVFDLRCCSALVGAYMEAGGRRLFTEADRTLLTEAVQLLLFELGLRFFTDYLEGNPYFTVRYPGQNLQRAVGQFRLQASLAAQKEALHRELAGILT